MARTDDINHVQVVLLDQSIEVDIKEVKAGGGAPMPEQARFDVVELERSFEQRIILQIDLPDREVICSTPVSVHLFQKIGRQRGGRGVPYGLALAPGPDDREDSCADGRALCHVRRHDPRGDLAWSQLDPESDGASTPSNWLRSHAFSFGNLVHFLYRQN